MNSVARIKASDLNENLSCGLCFGYLIDAATIAECLHSFCRSCIIRRLTEKSSGNTCPLCCQVIHKTNPMASIRSDKALQSVVYKLIPGLFKREMSRRRKYYSEHSDDAPNLHNPNSREERGEITDEPWLRHDSEDEEKISLCLQYKAIFPQSHPNTPEANNVKYLLCPEYVTIAVLKKFISFKFELPSHVQVELFCSDELLSDGYSLLDVASLQLWKRRKPLQLFYLLFATPPTSARIQNENEDESSVLKINSELSISKERLRNAFLTTSNEVRPLFPSTDDSLDDSSRNSSIENFTNLQKQQNSYRSSQKSVGKIRNNVLRRLNSFKMKRRRAFKSFANSRKMGVRNIGRQRNSCSNASEPHQKLSNCEDSSRGRCKFFGLENTAPKSIIFDEEASCKKMFSVNPKLDVLPSKFPKTEVAVSEEMTSPEVQCSDWRQSPWQRSPASTEPRSIWSVLPSICSGSHQLTSGGQCSPEDTARAFPSGIIATLGTTKAVTHPTIPSRRGYEEFEDNPVEEAVSSTTTTHSTPHGKVGVFISHGRALPIQSHRRQWETFPGSLRGGQEPRKRPSGKVESENKVKVKHQVENSEKKRVRMSSALSSSRQCFSGDALFQQPSGKPKRKRILCFQDVNTFVLSRSPAIGSSPVLPRSMTSP